MTDFASARLAAAITYAVPINPVQLIAHLEAYTETKQEIIALNLCHRYGRGSDRPTRSIRRANAGLKKFQELPPELILLIEAFIVVPLRISLTKKYEKLFACFEQTCHYRDHFSDEELDKIDDEQTDVLMETDERFKNFNITTDSDEMSETYMEALMEKTDEVLSQMDFWEAHSDNSETWYCSVTQHYDCDEDTSCDRPRFKFCSLAAEMERSFGVRALLKTQTLPFHLWDLFELGVTQGDRDYRTTICYLHLPVKSSLHEADSLDDTLEYENTVRSIGACLDEAVDLDDLIAMKSKMPRLQLALRKLSLTPSVHWSTIALRRDNAGILSTDGERKEYRSSKAKQMCSQHKKEFKESIEEAAVQKTEMFKKKGPQLMLLAAANSRCGHDY